MIRNSLSQWGWPAKILHWLGFILILTLLVHGWWMTHVIARPDRLANYAWHAALGYDLLLLTVLRLLWRWMNPVPALPSDLKPWERLSAHAGHVALYVLMLAATLTGWVLAGTFRVPMTTDLFGISFPMIALGDSRTVHEISEEAHEILAYVLAVVIVVHVIGALRHHLAKHNDILKRMVFQLRRS